MNRLRELAPWQIISLAVVSLLVFLVGAYFIVTLLTKAPSAGTPSSVVPTDLGKEANAKVVEDLGSFESPSDLPNLVDPLRPADPNTPSFANPFSS